MALLLPAALSPRHALAGPIPVFSCFSADSESSIPGLTISNTHTSSFPRRIFAPGVLHPCFTHPESRGGRSAEKRSGAALSTRGRASVSGMTRIRAANSSQPGRSAWRATSRASRGQRLRAARRRTPLPAPPSGSSPETPLDERGWESI